MMPAIAPAPLFANLPGVPPFQLLPEADLNFEAVLEALPEAAPAPTVPVPVQAAPVEATEPVEAVEALLSSLGITPAERQAVAPQNEEAKAEMPEKDLEEVSELPLPFAMQLFSGEGGSPDLNKESFGFGSGLPPSRENGPDLPSLIPILQQNANRATLKPSLPPPVEEDGSASTATRSEPVQTDFEVTVSPQRQSGLSQLKPSLAPNPEEKGSTSTVPLREPVRTELGAVTPSFTQPGLSEIREPSPAQPIASTQNTDPLRFVVERQLDLARDNRWLDALARDIVAVADRPDQLSFRLMPPRLGRLDVDMSSSESGLSLRLNASTEAAAQIINAAQPRLIDELKGQGVRIAEAQVSTGSGGSQGQGQQQQQRNAEQMIEFVRERITRAEHNNPTRPIGRFA
jgi:flagellar hook-length control protein FliK